MSGDTFGKTCEVQDPHPVHTYKTNWDSESLSYLIHAPLSPGDSVTFTGLPVSANQRLELAVVLPCQPLSLSHTNPGSLALSSVWKAERKAFRACTSSRGRL